MDKFDSHGALYDGLGRAGARGRRRGHQQRRPETLPAGIDEVGGHFG